MIKKFTTIILTASTIIPFVAAHSADASLGTAPVSGFARSFVMGTPISGAKVTVLETGQTVTTDNKGKFGPFLYPVGKPITLVLESFGYQTTQSETVVVPPHGLTGDYNNITFQVPSFEAYYAISKFIGAELNKNSCHVATTITAYHKTLDDLPQGEVDATVFLSPAVNVVPFYFGIVQEGPFKGKTNPFTRGLTKTSEDGGVAFFNLPPRDKPYTISAIKSGVVFTEAKFLCRSGVFINVSPPRGPMVVG